MAANTQLNLRVPGSFLEFGKARCYHDDFETPGISPRSANPRKHNRQMPNLRMYARGRPQILQRLCLRVENLGFFTLCGLTLLSAPSLTRFAVVAKNQLLAFALRF
jgi:hypothetical protein